MIYDDIANDPQNPFPGKLFNKPTAQGTPVGSISLFVHLCHFINAVLSLL
jgi:legumain